MRSPAAPIVLVLSAQVVLGFPLPWEARGPDDPLSLSIAAIVADDDGTRAGREVLETRLLALTEEHGSPEDKGLIYASIAKMFRRPAGGVPAGEPMQENAIEYAKRALQQPLDDVNVCEMYSTWGQAASAGWPELKPGDFAAVRRRTVLLYLLGLKYALDHGATAEPEPGPPARRYDVVGAPDSPEMRAAAERRAAELEARRRADRLEGLSLHRRLFMAQCEALYRRPPADPAELRAFAEAVLVRYDDVVDEIMAKVE